MKVRLVFNVEVDPDRWDEVYGTGTRARDVVNDVRSYYLTHMQGAPGTEETGATVEAVR